MAEADSEHWMRQMSTTGGGGTLHPKTPTCGAGRTIKFGPVGVVVHEGMTPEEFLEPYLEEIARTRNTDPVMDALLTSTVRGPMFGTGVDMVVEDTLLDAKTVPGEMVRVADTSGKEMWAARFKVPKRPRPQRQPRAPRDKPTPKAKRRAQRAARRRNRSR